MTANAPPFTPINREKGRVIAKDVRGEKVVYAAQLSAVPPAEWKRLFQEGPYTSYPEVCDPQAVTFIGGELAALSGSSYINFESKEAHAPLWLQTIDEWIRDTNRRYEEFLRAQQRADDALEDRLRKATEAIKDL